MKLRTLIPLAALLLITANSAAAQTTKKATDPILGTWKGTSICFPAFKPPCHDEVVVYYLSQSPDKPGMIAIRADKIVNGTAEDMGIIDCKFDKEKSSLECAIPSGTFKFTARGKQMDGGLWAPDQAQIRRINLTKESSATSPH
jgi:hypothetical protein